MNKFPFFPSVVRLTAPAAVPRMLRPIRRRQILLNRLLPMPFDSSPPSSSISPHLRHQILFFLLLFSPPPLTSPPHSLNPLLFLASPFSSPSSINLSSCFPLCSRLLLLLLLSLRLLLLLFFIML